MASAARRFDGPGILHDRRPAGGLPSVALQHNVSYRAGPQGAFAACTGTQVSNLGLRRNLFGDLRAPAFWAGITGFIWYAFGAVPLHVAVSEQLGLEPSQTSSWVFIVWFSGAIASLLLTVGFRQPIPITWSIPGLIYLGTLAGRFSFPEIVGANLVAGILILVLAILGIGGRLMRWLPLPIIMGMFAGSMMGYLTRMVNATVDDVLIAGLTIVGFLIGRAAGRSRLPPVGLAVIFGGVAAIIAGRMAPAPVDWAAPSVGLPAIEFSAPAVMAISLPMVILAMGMGNVQGLGFLVGQGYRVPVNRISVVIGVNSIVNALFGGHAAIVARTGVAILASPDAGPLHLRYWANIVAATLTLGIAFAASPIASLIAILPRAYVFALAGLAIFTSLQDAFQRAFEGKLRAGALTAFAVAATPFEVAGITSAFWAVVVGLVVALLVERDELLAVWRPAPATTDS